MVKLELSRRMKELNAMRDMPLRWLFTAVSYLQRLGYTCMETPQGKDRIIHHPEISKHLGHLP